MGWMWSRGGNFASVLLGSVAGDPVWPPDRSSSELLSFPAAEAARVLGSWLIGPSRSSKYKSRHEALRPKLAMRISKQAKSYFSKLSAVQSRLDLQKIILLS